MRFPAKIICCHGEGFAEPAALIMRYSEAAASHLALALKARSFPAIKGPLRIITTVLHPAAFFLSDPARLYDTEIFSV